MTVQTKMSYFVKSYFDCFVFNGLYFDCFELGYSDFDCSKFGCPDLDSSDGDISDSGFCVFF